MAGLSTVMAQRVLNYLFRGIAPATNPGIVGSLHTADPGDAGTTGELSGMGYARQPATFAAPSGKSIALSTSSDFTNLPGAWILYIGAWTTDGSPVFIGGMPNGELKAFAVEADDDTFTSAAHGLVDGMPVALLPVTGASLPTGVSADTPYYVRDAATNTFKLALTQGGSAINLTTDGAGTVRRIQKIDPGDSVSVLAGSSFSFTT